MAQPRTYRDLALGAAVAAAYFAAGKIGLSLAFVNASASAVWPPTGIAIASLLIFGHRVWPGVLLGAFLVNVTTAGGMATSIGIGIGNTLEAVVASGLVRRFAHGRRCFDVPRDIFAYALLAGTIGTTVSATIGVACLLLGRLASGPQAPGIWLTWWLGDAAGALVVAPFLVLWAERHRLKWSGRKLLEAVLMFAYVIATGLFVFGGMPVLGSKNLPVQFLCFPGLAWATFRFRQREVATAVVILSGIAIAGTLRGLGPFARLSQNESLLLLQAFMALISVMFLASAAAVSERNRVEASILRLNEQLEDRVSERTVQLSTTNLELRRQIRERTRAQDQLEQSEARLREAQRMARIGSWEWDIANDTLWWSDELYEIYGVDPETFELRYENYLERINPEDLDLVRSTIETALRDARPFSFEHRIVRADGQILVVHGQGRVITDSSGLPIRMMGTGQDITEAKRAEEARAHLVREQIARREAEQANRVKDEFLATLSHELRTPLNAIVGWSHLLGEGKLDAAAAAHAVETIRRNARIQSHLISDILDISRMSVGQLELKKQPVDLAQVVAGAIDTMRPAAEAKRVEVAANLDARVPPVLGDPDRLQQVAWNLLSNAIKFAADGGRVEISLASDGTSARIEVVDDGPGIDPDFLPHVFERFRQRDAARRQAGLGLGLAIVSQLVEMHGGAVAAMNREVGHGARFVVTLPLPGAYPEPVGDGEPGAYSEQAVAGAQRRLAGTRVMLVEDDADSRELVTTLLERCGVRVRAFDACDEALAAFGNEAPDVVISDIRMPGETGYDLIAKIRSFPKQRGGSVPAVALTAYAGAEDVRMSIDSGYDAHLAKPVQFQELVMTLAQLMAAGAGPSSRRSGRPAAEPGRERAGS